MDGRFRSLLDDVAGGRRLESSDALGLAACDDLPSLMDSGLGVAGRRSSGVDLILT